MTRARSRAIHRPPRSNCIRRYDRTHRFRHPRCVARIALRRPAVCSISSHLPRVCPIHCHKAWVGITIILFFDFFSSGSSMCGFTLLDRSQKDQASNFLRQPAHQSVACTSSLTVAPFPEMPPRHDGSSHTPRSNHHAGETSRTPPYSDFAASS